MDTNEMRRIEKQLFLVNDPQLADDISHALLWAARIIDEKRRCESCCWWQCNIVMENMCLCERYGGEFVEIKNPQADYGCNQWESKR